MSALPKPGDVVGGKYRIVRIIGEGGMGTVYEAHHQNLGSNVALKFLHPDFQKNPPLVARFLQEARVSASLKNAHVTQVIDVDQTADGAAYLVMELLEGQSLEQRMARSSPLPLAEAVDIGIQILSALEAAHAHGVVHRDLKPDNVWLTPTAGGPFVKLLDFGIAKLKGSEEFKEVNTRPGSMMGTPAYMAPEQAISADQVDGRADLYSFGVILFEMLSGKRPVASEDPREILEHLVRGDVLKLSTMPGSSPPGLAALVDRLVAPNPDHRPRTATVVREELVPYARASGMVWLADRASSIPKTLPPDDHPPNFASHEPAPQPKTKTDSMPEVSELAFAPTAVAAPPARRRTWPWVVLGVFVAAGGTAAIWASQNPSVFDDSALPPLPSAEPDVPSSARAVEQTAPTDDGEPGVRAQRPTVAQTRPETQPTARDRAAPPAVPTFPALGVPPFAIPSGLIPSSLPSSLPSALTPFLQQIPGWKLPMSGQGGAAAAPAPAATAPTPSAASSQ